jgi:hypothetical protein
MNGYSRTASEKPNFKNQIPMADQDFLAALVWTAFLGTWFWEFGVYTLKG